MKTVLILALVAPLAFAQQTGAVFPPGATPKLLSEGFLFTEGPIADAQGNVYFTDQPNNKILKWTVDGKLSVFSADAGRANGLYIDKAGNLYACADLRNELWKIDPAGKVTVLVKDFDGKRLNGPNDLWVHPNGGIYFTDPFYRRDYWQHTTMEQDGQHVYYLAPGHTKLTRVTTDLQQPNGIIGTPDGKRLYIADIRASKIYVYDINADGTLANKREFTNMGSDGMTMDDKENIYLVGRGVTVFNKEGRQIDHVDIPERWTANVTLGGPNRNILYITASDSLYSIPIQ